MPLKKEFKKNGPWKIKKRDLVYQNPWINVFEDSVIRPDGKDGIFGMVQMGKGVNILPIDNQGYVYLIKEFRYIQGSYDIGVCGGKVEEGEDHLKAAKRELKEELGIEANKWKYAEAVHPLASIVKSTMYQYIVTDFITGNKDLDKTENIRLFKVKLDKAVEMVLKGKIFYAPSCLLILKAYYNREKL